MQAALLAIWEFIAQPAVYTPLFGLFMALVHKYWPFLDPIVDPIIEKIKALFSTAKPAPLNVPEEVLAALADRAIEAAILRLQQTPKPPDAHS